MKRPTMLQKHIWVSINNLKFVEQPSYNERSWPTWINKTVKQTTIRVVLSCEITINKQTTSIVIQDNMSNY